MSLVVRQVTLDDAEGITNVLNPIIIEGLYTVLDTTFTPEEEKEFIANFLSAVCLQLRCPEVTQRLLVSKILSRSHNTQKLLTT